MINKQPKDKITRFRKIGWLVVILSFFVKEDTASLLYSTVYPVFYWQQISAL